MRSMGHTWRRTAGRSVSAKYVCCGVPAFAVNDNGKVDRVCGQCGAIVYDGGANEQPR